jgi:hypothetical protein
MIAQDRSYPHPVLAPFRDDVSPNAFVLELSATFDADNYYMDVGLLYDNPTITGLVDGGRAAHAVHIECKRNFFRHLYLFPERSRRIAVRASELIGRVEVTAMVVTTAAIDDYRIVGAHADYGDTEFRLRKGDVLGMSQSSIFDAYTDYDPLKRLSSILSIWRSETAAEGPMVLATAGDRIIATLSQYDYDQYTDLRADPRLASLLSNQVVVPALPPAVFELANDRDEDIEEGMARRWYRSVDAKLRETGTDVRAGTHTPLDAVQKLLREPLRRSLVGLLQATAEDGEQ